MKEVVGFVARMDERQGWVPLPILVTSGSTGRPVDHGFFLRTIRTATAGLRGAGPLDGVYVCNHGAMTTTEREDGDALFFAAFGADVPMCRRGDVPTWRCGDVRIVAPLDPHANVSDRMLDAVDLVVACRTDPHTDPAERGAEAADLLHEPWKGARFWTASLRLPIVPPDVSLFPDPRPFAEMVQLGQRAGTPRTSRCLAALPFPTRRRTGCT